MTGNDPRAKIQAPSRRWAVLAKGIALAPPAVALITVLVPSYAVAQQSFYVTQNGSGAQTGQSAAAAWSLATFENSASWSATESSTRIDPGDTVYFCGTFNLSSNDVRPAGSGTATEPITLRGDCASSPAMFNGSSTGGSGFHVEGRSHLVLSNLRFESDLAVEIRVRDSHHITIRDSSIATSRNKAIETSGSGHHLYIHDNIIRATTADGGRADGIGLWQGPWDHIWIYRNYIADFNHSGVAAIGDAPEQDPPRHDEISYVYIYENEFEAPTRGYARAWNLNDGHHFYVYRNYIHDHRAPSQISSRLSYVYNNIFADQRNCCTTGNETGCVEAYANCATKTWYGTGQHLVVSTYAQVPDDLSVYNNLFVDSSEAAIKLGDAGPVTSRPTIVNNVILNAALAPTPSDSPPGSEATWVDYGVVFDSTVSGLTFNNNLLYTPSRSEDIRYNGAAYTVAEFNALAGVTADNNLAVAPGLNGFVPANASSPVVDSGLTATGPEDPTGGLPADGTYAHALHPSSRWPDGVVIALQGDYGAWERGPFVFTGTKPTYIARRLRAAPTMDGVLSEYAEAPSIPLNAGAASGTYRLAWDQSALYVALEVADSQLNSTIATRDGQLWKDDSLEMMVDVNRDGGAGDMPGLDDYKFFVNLLNTHLDTRGGGSGTAWNATWESVVRVDGGIGPGAGGDAGYTIELRLPWSVIAVSAPANGSHLGFELNLNNLVDAGTRTYDAWSNVDGGSLNNPDGWGVLVLSDKLLP